MKFITLCALLGLTVGAPIYDPNLSDVTNYTKLNFDK